MRGLKLELDAELDEALVEGAGPVERGWGGDVASDVDCGGRVEAGDVRVVKDIRRFEEEFGGEAFANRNGPGVAHVDFERGGGKKSVTADVERPLEGGTGGGVSIQDPVAAEVEVFTGLSVDGEAELVVVGEIVPSFVGAGGAGVPYGVAVEDVTPIGEGVATVATAVGPI